MAPRVTVSDGGIGYPERPAVHVDPYPLAQHVERQVRELARYVQHTAVLPFRRNGVR